VTQNNEENYYHLIEDYDLIEASFAQQYGIRLRNENEMSWGEFSTLLHGINSDTPFGRIISIRAEKNRKKIKDFSKEERRIYNEWHRKKANVVTDKKQYEHAMASFEQMFASMSRLEMKSNE